MEFIARKYGRAAFAEHAKNLEPTDPHYETFVDHKGRTKSRKRKMPEGLSKADQRILRSVRRRAHYLDKGFSICGFRFGWTAIFGLIPIAGDVVAFLLSYLLVIRKARQANLPLSIQQRMAFNQAVSVGTGMIPLVGDIILAVWKANSRNAALLEEFLIARAKATAAHTLSPAAAEAQAATQALQNSQIEKLTGERVGAPPAYVFSEDEDTGDEGVGVVTGAGGMGGAGTTTGARKVPRAQNTWYGWATGGNSSGGKGKGRAEDDGTTTALLSGQGASSSAVGAGSTLKKR